jgi:hypothetical protein
MFNTKEKIQSLGILAESVVKNYFEKNGSVVEMAADPFDSSMDMLIDGKTTEVKFMTIRHFFKSHATRGKVEPAFTVPITTQDNRVAQNQLDKCLNAHRWIIVQNPSDKEHETTIKLWEANPLGMRRFSIIQNSKDKRIIAGFLMKDFKLLTDIDDSKLYNKIKSLNLSHYS